MDIHPLSAGIRYNAILRKVVATPSFAMAATLAQINQWLAEPSEHRRLEFKEAKSSFSKSRLCKYCVALANAGGGHLVLGVTDEPPRRVAGTNAFAGNLIAVEHEVLQETGVCIATDELAHPDGRVLVFSIPGRPQGAAYRYKGAYWMRVGESTVIMPDQQLREIFAETQPEWLDAHAKSGLSAEEISALLDVPAFFALQKTPMPGRTADALRRLAARNCIERNGQGYAIRRMGALLFAKRLSDFPELENKAVRVLVYIGTSKLKTRRDWTCDKGYAAGFEEIVKYVMEQIPQQEVIRNGIREEHQLLPEEMTRELLVNAAVHQDFLMRGKQLRVDIYSNRIEFSNPGEPLVEPDRFIDGENARNEKLIGLMRRLGFCEQRGSGIDQVVLAAEANRLRPPEFRREPQQTTVRVHGAETLSRMGRVDRIRACYQHCVLKYVTGEDSMTNQSLRERFGASPRSASVVSSIIADTGKASLIKPDARAGKSRRYAKYIPAWA